MGPLVAVGLTLAVDPAALVLIAVGLLWYGRAVRRVTRAGGAWPVGRTVSAVTAAVAALLATNGWVAANDRARFSAHATQHLLLALVVPMAVVLAAPLSLALRRSTPPTRAVLRRWSTARPLQILAHPVVAGAIFTATVVAMYATPLFSWSLTSAPVHLLVHAHLVLIGLLFLWPLVGFDPAPVRVPHPARVALLLMVLPLHALLAVVLMGADPPLGSPESVRLALAAGADPVAEQRLGAGILWAGGDLIALVAVGIACYRWWRADTAFTRTGTTTRMVGTSS
jgi:cytochrome c oxidase assembly factor CtaG